MVCSGVQWCIVSWCTCTLPGNELPTRPVRVLPRERKRLHVPGGVGAAEGERERVVGRRVAVAQHDGAQDLVSLEHLRLG